MLYGRQLRNTYRRRRYLPNNSRWLRVFFFIILLLLVFTLGYFLFKYWLSVGNAQIEPVQLNIENSDNVKVSLNGGELRRAANKAKLFPGDRMVTENNGQGVLLFFDGTIAFLDENTDLTINESYSRESVSALTIKMDTGRMWFASPQPNTDYPGQRRTIRLPRLILTVPDKAEIYLNPSSLYVFSADKEGVKVEIPKTKQQLFVGEGQQFIIPDSALSENLYEYRGPLSYEILEDPFIKLSKNKFPEYKTDLFVNTNNSDSLPASDLTIISPREDGLIEGSTVEVSGTASENVTTVFINGYQTSIDDITRRFFREFSLIDQEMVINIQAFDEENKLLAEIDRTVKKRAQKLPAPVITLPEADEDGEYKTTDIQIEIRGTTDAQTENIVVNNYTLQLYKPGNTTWSYVANTEIGNLKYGENVFEVYSLSYDGTKSEPAEITVILEKTETPENAELTNETDDQLPDNTPLYPGTLLITKPSAAMVYETKITNVVIEGTTHEKTDSIWVNGYRLQLYEGGKYWNYIASPKLRTMKRGENVYEVVARDKDGRVLDKLTYTIVLKL